jgi:hypothetical protein
VGQLNDTDIGSGVKWNVLRRELIFPFFFILAIVVLFYFIFFNIIVKFFRWASSCCYNRKDVVHPYYTHEFSFYTSTMSIMPSYNIKNNIKYKNAIINVEEYLRSENLK